MNQCKNQTQHRKTNSRTSILVPTNKLSISPTWLLSFLDPLLTSLFCRFKIIHSRIPFFFSLLNSNITSLFPIFSFGSWWKYPYKLLADLSYVSLSYFKHPFHMDSRPNWNRKVATSPFIENLLEGDRFFPCSVKSELSLVVYKASHGRPVSFSLNTP